MRISDWSSDVCSSDLDETLHAAQGGAQVAQSGRELVALPLEQRGDRGHRVVEVAHHVVVLGEGLDELLELGSTAEQLVFVVLQGPGPPPPILDRLVALLALAGELVGGGAKQPGYSTFAVSACWAKRDGGRVEA